MRFCGVGVVALPEDISTAVKVVDDGQVVRVTGPALGGNRGQTEYILQPVCRRAPRIRQA